MSRLAWSWLLLVALVGACQGASTTSSPSASPPGTPPPSADVVTLSGRAVAGPTCPVESEPPDPACEDRPVAGAEILIRGAAGETVATARTAEDGSFSVSLPAGRYEVVPQPVEGLMGTAAAVDVVVPEGGQPEPIILAYDTGIR
jgi:hypothetical protein